MVDGVPTEIEDHPPDEDDMRFMQWLSMSNHEGSMLQTALGVPEIRKYLPPGTSNDLFELFDVTQQSTECATVSWSTFLRVYKDKWQNILRFRDKSSFTSCELCGRYKGDLLISCHDVTH